jgi:hypothetical protein
MSGVFQGLLGPNGRINNGVGPIVSHFRGLPFNALGQVVFGDPPVVHFDQGIPFNAAGEVVGEGAGTASYFGPGATPYGPNGELVGRNDPTVDIYQGVPYLAGGAYAIETAFAEALVIKRFTLTIAQFSASSRGYRTTPLAGSLTPDLLYAGGTIDVVQFTDADEVRVVPLGGAPFPDIDGDLSVIFAARFVLHWDVNLYQAIVPGIYAVAEDFIGVPTEMRLAGTPI